MASCSRKPGNPERKNRPEASPRTVGEPVMRRWPHSAESGGVSAAQDSSALHYIYCALSYQNQLLADIKALLEQLELSVHDETSEK